MQFRDNWDGKFKPDGPRFFSAFSEYVFQFGRMAQCNSPVVSILGWFNHTKHYLYQQFMEANSMLPVPSSCRGIPHTIERVDIARWGAPPGWHPTDEQIVLSIDKGVQRAIGLLQYCGVDTDLTQRSGFFKSPYKHFPLADTYVIAAARCAEADAADKENNPDGNDEEINLTTLDAQDAADAEARCSRR